MRVNNIISNLMNGWNGWIMNETWNYPTAIITTNTNIDILWNNLSAKRQDHDLCGHLGKLSLWCQWILAHLPWPSWFCCCCPFPNQSWYVYCGRKTCRYTDHTIHTFCWNLEPKNKDVKGKGSKNVMRILKNQ